MTEYRFPDAISYGPHPSPNEGACVMEVVSLFAGEPFSDQPACACPLITTFATHINDRLPDDASRTRLLGPLVPLIAGSRRDAETERRRVYIAADYAVRVFAPLALDARGCSSEAANLRALSRIHNRETALRGKTAAADAAYAAYAAADAADAVDAAYAAAYAAADAVADADAYAAADAAASSASSAVYAAAAAASSAVWEQAIACLRVMCETE